jgi:signal recognition particle subunit SEC65
MIRQPSREFVAMEMWVVDFKLHSSQSASLGRKVRKERKLLESLLRSMRSMVQDLQTTMKHMYLCIIVIPPTLFLDAQ